MFFGEPGDVSPVSLSDRVPVGPLPLMPPHGNVHSPIAMAVATLARHSRVCHTGGLSLVGLTMSVVHFQCPSCQAPLRLENRALFVGRLFDCPDCGDSLLIENDGGTGVKAKRSQLPTQCVREATQTSATDSTPSRRVRLETVSKVSDRGVDLQSPMSMWDRLSRRPALLGWIVAALFAIVLLVVVSPGRKRKVPETDTPAVGENKVPKAASQKPSEQNLPTAVDPNLTTSKKDDQPVDVEATGVIEKPDPPAPDVAKDLPRDGKLPEEAPPTEKPATEAPQPVAVPPPPEPAPVSTVLSAETIEAKLRQKITSFEQMKPVAFVKLLDTIEELAGVPIVWDLDRVTDEQLQKTVTIRLKETTVGEILDTLLKQVGLERRSAEGKIELQPRAETVPRS